MWPFLHYLALHVVHPWIFDVFILVVIPHFFPCAVCREHSRCHIRKLLSKMQILLPSQQPEKFVFEFHNQVNKMLKKPVLAWDLYERDKLLGKYDHFDSMELLWIAIFMEWDQVEAKTHKSWAWTAMNQTYSFPIHKGSCEFTLPTSIEKCTSKHHAPSLHVLQAQLLPFPLMDPPPAASIVCSLLQKLAHEHEQTMEEEWKRIQKAFEVTNPETCHIGPGCE